MKPNSSILEKTIELAKEYARSGAVNTPSDIEDFLQLAYDKLTELEKDVG